MNNRNIKYVNLKEAREISGYSTEYLASLLREKKIAGKKIRSDFGFCWFGVN